MVGKRIQYYRQRKRLSLTELASRAGVAKSYLSSIERNLQQNPSIDFLQKIAWVLNVDVYTLISEEEPAGTEAGVDEEWMQLVREAQEAGVSIETVRDYVKYVKGRTKPIPPTT